MTIVYILIALLAGWAIGFFDSNMRTTRKIKAAEAKAEMAVREAQEKAAASQPGTKSGPQAMPVEPGLLSLRNTHGNPSLELDGSPVDVRTMSGDQKKRLFELLGFIRSWVENGTPLQGPAASTSAQPQASPSYAAASAGAAPIPSQPAMQSRSVIAQIDAVLQLYLANSPLAGKGIRLTERTSSGGIQVHVGSQQYPSLADVPDPMIKAAVRAAITEWEQKNAPASKPGGQPQSAHIAEKAPAARLTSAKPPPPARPMNEREFRSLSIVAQIDTLLQIRLEDTPHADVGIRLVERTSLGGVEVFIGDQKYPSLDDVPDQEIKSIIRATIAEWEKKYTPGA